MSTSVSISTSLIKARIASLQAELAKEQEALEAAKPKEPKAEHAVIRFAKYGSIYCFAAIRVRKGGEYLWYITQDGTRTSRQGHAPKTWDELLVWIGERNWDGIEVLS